MPDTPKVPTGSEEPRLQQLDMDDVQKSAPHPPSSLEVELLSAAEAGHAEKVRELLAAGADPNAARECHKWNRSPLLLAADVGNTDAVRLLLEAGADPKQTDRNGGTPLHYAAGRRITGDSHGRLPQLLSINEVVRLLLAAGADPNASDVNGGTPLHSAAHFGCPEAARLILEAGGNPDVQDTTGYTPLHNACVRGYLEVAQVLVMGGADLTVVEDDDGQMPLHLVCEEGRAEMVELLVKAGAPLDVKDSNGMTPLELAENKGFLHIAAMLRTASEKGSHA